MHATRKHRQLQQAAIKKYANNTETQTFFNVLTGPELFDVIESNLPNHRERRFPPTETLAMFLSQALNADRSCQQVVNETVLARANCGLSWQSTNTGSYCKARQRLPQELICQLLTHTGRYLSAHSPQDWLWHGRSVKLIDGTTVELPDTEANRLAYPQTRQGNGCPLSRLVGIFCLGSGSLLNAAIGPFTGKGTGEQSLLRSLLDTFSEGDIVVGDAYFGSYFLLAELQRRGIDALFEQYGARKRSVDFRRGESLGKKDHLIVYSKPKKPDWLAQSLYDLMPDSLTVRELAIGHKILVTTMRSPKVAPKAELKKLYQQRWHIELDLRNIKTTLGMTMVTCKSPEMVEKEIWVYLLAYNLIRLVMAQAALLSSVLPRQLSFKHALQLWRTWRNQMPTNDNAIGVLLMLIAEKRVGNRPGRVEPRAVKRWRNPYPLLTQPRQSCRDNIKKYGHPRKQK